MKVPYVVAVTNYLNIRKRLRTSSVAYVAFAVVIGMSHTGHSAVVHDATDAELAAVTASDAAIPLDHLKVAVRPLTKDELEVELEAWLDLLKAKIMEVGETELKLMEVAADEEAGTQTDAAIDATNETLASQLVDLRTEEMALLERLRIVIEALSEKGGDVQSAEMYIGAVSGLDEAVDRTSRIAWVTARVAAWFNRDDGGKHLLGRAVVAAIILLISWIASKFVAHAVERALERQARVSKLLTNFARRSVGGVLFMIGVLMAIATLGVPIAPLMAVLGGGGFIIAFALQDTLGNFASGMMIMIYRPFDLEDYVGVAGAEGFVKQMSLVSTTLITFDNKLLVIPNKTVWHETITNFTGTDTRRVDLIFSISYEENVERAVDVLKEVASAHELVLDDPEVTVNIHKLDDSSVNLFCRPWVKTDDYWRVYWDLTREVKDRFDAEGITIPFPQRDVHVHQTSDPAQSNHEFAEGAKP